jgi:hypothetical protein
MTGTPATQNQFRTVFVKLAVSLEDTSDGVVHLTTVDMGGGAQYLPKSFFRLFSCLGGYLIGHDSFSLVALFTGYLFTVH